MQARADYNVAVVLAVASGDPVVQVVPADNFAVADFADRVVVVPVEDSLVDLVVLVVVDNFVDSY